ncbi:proline-rich membrane anchor 1-like [Megalobrama amblycephala]|uniref:proline-rich membrane anchor 1-like n=1 Tax=Megalobrama amblycephala TaxID=75352 RepID=UPI0020141297|nr:proline-rich membrane anchor 1-like [Megalobrama amblycephala]
MRSEGCWSRSDFTRGLSSSLTVCSRRVFSPLRRSSSRFAHSMTLTREVKVASCCATVGRTRLCLLLPPPPPPPALLSMAPEASAPLLGSWWMEIIVVGTTGSALAVFLLLTVIIFYKAIKRKPLKNKKNGTGCGEDATSSLKKTNNAAV